MRGCADPQIIVRRSMSRDPSSGPDGPPSPTRGEGKLKAALELLLLNRLCGCCRLRACETHRPTRSSSQGRHASSLLRHSAVATHRRRVRPGHPRRPNPAGAGARLAAADRRRLSEPDPHGGGAAGAVHHRQFDRQAGRRRRRGAAGGADHRLVRHHLPVGGAGRLCVRTHHQSGRRPVEPAAGRGQGARDPDAVAGAAERRADQPLRRPDRRQGAADHLLLGAGGGGAGRGTGVPHHPLGDPADAVRGVRPDRLSRRRLWLGGAAAAGQVHLRHLRGLPVPHLRRLFGPAEAARAEGRQLLPRRSCGHADGLRHLVVAGHPARHPAPDGRAAGRAPGLRRLRRAAGRQCEDGRVRRHLSGHRLHLHRPVFPDRPDADAVHPDRPDGGAGVAGHGGRAGDQHRHADPDAVDGGPAAGGRRLHHRHRPHHRHDAHGHQRHRPDGRARPGRQGGRPPEPGHI
uniref:Integral membrane protein n=1 Tax=Parastrongyloides trichosuri TaxID=131310 RepID=A0A0N4Z6A9_PARTI